MVECLDTEMIEGHDDVDKVGGVDSGTGVGVENTFEVIWATVTLRAGEAVIEIV